MLPCLLGLQPIDAGSRYGNSKFSYSWDSARVTALFEPETADHFLAPERYVDINVEI